MIVDFLGGKIDLDPDDDEMSELMRTTRWEWRKVEYMQSQLKPGMIFVDAGAYVGYFTLIAAKLVGDQGCIYAFEPDSRNLSKLLDNLELNDDDTGGIPGTSRVWTHPYALSDYKGKGTLAYREHRGWSSLIREGFGNQVQEVPISTINDMLWHEDHIDMMKIDVEGAEAAVLRGASWFLERNHPMSILMDLHPELGVDPKPVEAILKNRGFSLYDMRSGNVPIDHIATGLVELLAVKR